MFQRFWNMWRPTGDGIFYVLIFQGWKCFILHLSDNPWLPISFQLCSLRNCWSPFSGLLLKAITSLMLYHLAWQPILLQLPQFRCWVLQLLTLTWFLLTLNLESKLHLVLLLLSFDALCSMVLVHFFFPYVLFDRCVEAAGKANS